MTYMSFRITPVYDVLLRGTEAMPVGLYHLHLATAAQLTRLHYKDGSLKSVKKRLKVLVDNGFVQADSIPTRQFRSPYYYTLTSRGMNYLSASGIDVPESYRGSREMDKHALFIAHTQELNDLIISALLLKRVSPISLDSFVHERTLRARSFKTRNFTIIPDAFLRFTQGGKPVRFLVEHDRGTEEQAHFRRRIAAYKDYLQQEPITVLFSTFQGEKRREQMREWTRKELAGSPTASYFRFASFALPLDPPSVWLKPNWYTLQADTAVTLLHEG